MGIHTAIFQDLESLGKQRVLKVAIDLKREMFWIIVLKPLLMYLGCPP